MFLQLPAAAPPMPAFAADPYPVAPVTPPPPIAPALPCASMGFRANVCDFQFNAKLIALFILINLRKCKKFFDCTRSIVIPTKRFAYRCVF